jgi:hypothetical protein
MPWECAARSHRAVILSGGKMYWDVVEVKPEPDCGLFVRFRDGLSGRVQLPREELIGVLAPLRDSDFFNRVFIDQGAVAWPGDIDLAPDAMYKQVASDADRVRQAS